MTNFISIEDANQIRTIRFDRADKKNAITRDMYTRMAMGLEEANEDNTRVVIIAGSEGVFTAGNDLIDFMEHPPHFGEAKASPVERFMRALMGCQKPVIACVDGLAIGIGTTLLLHCDLAYASDRSSFKTPFVDLALVPEFGSSQILPGMLGRNVASELLLLCETWDAQRAAEKNLINAVLPADQLEAFVLEKAHLLAAKSPGAVRKSLELMNLSPEDLEARIVREGQMFADLLKSDEFMEAVNAFMEPRAPDYSRFG